MRKNLSRYNAVIIVAVQLKVFDNGPVGVVDSVSSHPQSVAR